MILDFQICICTFKYDLHPNGTLHRSLFGESNQNIVSFYIEKDTTNEANTYLDEIVPRRVGRSNEPK